jgi:serine/threonine protein kinase
MDEVLLLLTGLSISASVVLRFRHWFSESGRQRLSIIFNRQALDFRLRSRPSDDPQVVSLLAHSGAIAAEPLSQWHRRQPIYLLRYQSGAAVVAKMATHQHPAEVSALFTEAHTLSFLTSREVKCAPRLLSVDNVGPGTPTLFRSYLAGSDLHTQFQAAVASGRKGPTVDDAIHVSLLVARCVSTVHRNGLIHGDIKPANLIGDFRVADKLSPAGDLKLIDFGSAQFVRGASPSLRRSGTLGFTAPERFFASNPMFQSDVYSLGAVLAFAFTGRPDIPGSSAGARIPEKVRAVVRKAMSVDPFDRYADAAEFLEVLSAVQASMEEHLLLAQLSWPIDGRRFSEEKLMRRSLPLEARQSSLEFSGRDLGEQTKALDSETMSLSYVIAQVFRTAITAEDYEFVSRFAASGLSLTDFAEETGLSKEQVRRRVTSIYRNLSSAVHDSAEEIVATS